MKIKFLFAAFCFSVNAATAFTLFTSDTQNIISFPTQTPAENNNSSFSKILNSFSSNKITIDEKIKYFAYAMFDEKKLPYSFKSSIKEKCGNWIIETIKSSWQELSAQTKNELAKYGFLEGGILSRPDLPLFKETTNFRIHYSATPGDTNAVPPADGDGNGIPDYVDSVMINLEFVRSFELNDIGFIAPPPDSAHGGNSKYDVYIQNMSLYGQVVPETSIGDNPNSSETELNAYTSYMLIENNFFGFANTGYENIRVTLAHEYFHSIQFGYDGFEALWLKEGTASWIEDEVFDNINDNYQYLTKWFKTPWVSLDADNNAVSNSSYYYGSWIFFRYLSEHLGASIVRTIWEKSIDNDSYLMDFSTVAIEQALNSYFTTFAEEFHNYSIANIIKNISPYDYEEGANYPSITSTNSLFNTQPLNDWINMRGCSYLKVAKGFPNNSSDFVKITFTPGNQNPEFSASVVTRKSGNVAVNRFFPGVNSFTLSPTTLYDDIWVVVSSLTTASRTTIQYDFSLQLERSNSLIQLSNFNTTELKSGRNVIGWSNSWDTLCAITFDNKNYNDDNILYFDPAHYSAEVVAVEGSPQYWYLYSFSNGLKKKLNIAQYDTAVTGDPPSFWLGAFDHYPQIDSGFVWASGYLNEPGKGEGLYKINISNLAYTKISNNRLNSNDELFVRGKSAAWAFYDGGLLRKFFESKNDGVKEIKSFNINSFDGVNLLGYDDNLMAWIEEKCIDLTNCYEKLVILNTASASIVFTDSVSGNYNKKPFFPSLKLHGSNVVYTRKNSSLDSVYFYRWNPVLGKKQFDTFPETWTSYRQIGAMNIIYTVLYDGQKFIFYHLFDGKKNYYEPGLGDGWGFSDVGLTYSHLVFLGKDSNTLRSFAFLKEVSTIVTDAHILNLPSPGTFILKQNYPNPFNPATKIEYRLQRDDHITLKIYDILGKEIVTLVDESKPAGNYNLSFNASKYSLASGVYFYKLKIGETVQVKKMLLLK